MEGSKTARDGVPFFCFLVELVNNEMRAVRPQLKRIPPWRKSCARHSYGVRKRYSPTRAGFPDIYANDVMDPGTFGKLKGMAA